jgi:hypothetical protein
MGYSIFVKLNNEDDLKQMTSFLTQHIDKPGPQTGYTLTTAPTYVGKYKEDLIIGFDYASWCTPDEREYIFSICRWVAYTLKIPTIIYDGCEEFKTENPVTHYNKFNTVFLRALGITQRMCKDIIIKIEGLTKLWEQRRN